MLYKGEVKFLIRFLCLIPKCGVLYPVPTFV